MRDLTAYIPALLHRYDCVVIPDLGGFVANYSPARLDKSRGVIYPPSKGILFNKNLDRNDGLLVSEMASNEGISYQEAMERISAFVYAAKTELAQGGRIELAGLGYLYFDQERNIQYLADQTENFLNDSFGLSPVMAVPVYREKAIEKTVELKPLMHEEVTVIKEKTVVAESAAAKVISIGETVKKTSNKNRRVYWAAAVLLPILFYTYWLPFQTPMLRTGHFSWTYLNPFGHYAQPQYQERNTTLPNEPVVLADQTSAHKVALPVKKYEKPDTETTYVPTPLVTGEAHYHVIAGCFVNYENAVSQIDMLKAAGSTAYMLGQANGFYRVAMGSFNTENEANAHLQAVRQNGQPNAWLLQE